MLLVSRHDAIQDANIVTNGTERIPLVLTYHPFNNHIKKDPSDELQHSDEQRNHHGDSSSASALLKSNRRDQNICDIHVHTFTQGQSGSPAGTSPHVVCVLTHQLLPSLKDHDTTPKGRITVV